MALSISQTTEEVYSSYLVPAHYEDHWVTVEDWGWSPPGGYEAPRYEWQVVGQDYFPPVYDENGNVIQEGHYEDRYDNVYVGTMWVPTDPVWIVTGTHQENQPIWINDAYEPYAETRYNAPVIHQRATRSDANWVWEVPTTGGNPRGVMRLWDGGLALAKGDGSIAMTIAPDSLFYTSGGKTTRMHADVTTYTTQVNNAGVVEVSETEVRPELVRLTRTETSGTSTTIGQTQIAAKSADFGGVVTVQGDLKVQGVLRVAAGGDLSMGEFTTSPAGITPP